MNDLLTVEIVACRRQFSGPEADTHLVDLAPTFHMDYMRANSIDPDPLCQIRDKFSICQRNKGRYSHLRSPPSIRSKTKKQFSSSWKA